MRAAGNGRRAGPAQEGAKIDRARAARACDRDDMRIYLINPRNTDNFWTMQSSVEAVGCKTLMPNCALATLVSLTPSGVDVEYVYCDENVSTLDLDMACDLAAVTGYTLHSRRICEISDAFRERGVAVALGGAFATLNPEKAEKFADHLFIGEAEHTWAQFLRDWPLGRALPRYEQKIHVDIKESPAPDWSLIDGEDYVNFSVQTNRGCPNNCDFCDAIRLVGRKIRTKTIDQIITELDGARAAGAEAIFFSEDNFFARPSFTKELLTEIVRWNTALRSPVSFYAQSTGGRGDSSTSGGRSLLCDLLGGREHPQGVLGRDQQGAHRSSQRPGAGNQAVELRNCAIHGLDRRL